MFTVPMRCQIWATRHRYIIKHAPYLHGIDDLEGRQGFTHEITSPTRIVLSTIQGKYRDFGEEITVWKRGPDPGVPGAGEGGAS